MKCRQRVKDALHDRRVPGEHVPRYQACSSIGSVFEEVIVGKGK
jgi:hypothetical protein